MRFQTTYDSTAKSISVIASALLAAVAIITQGPFVACLGAAFILMTFAWSPRGYTIAGQSILVHRLIGDVQIPLGDLQEIRVAGADDLQGCIRLFGNGGMFGYYGLFRTSKLGKCTWYVTNRDKAVVVVTRTKTVLVSPDDADGFLAAVRATVPIPPTPGSARSQHSP